MGLAMESEIVAPELESKALSIPEQAERIRVIDQATYTVACVFLRDTVAAMRCEIIDHHKPMKEAAHRSHRAACDAEKKLLEPIERAEQFVKQAIVAYDVEQSRIRREKEMLAQAEAQRKADEATEAALEQAERDGASVEEVRAMIEEPIAMPRPFVEQTHQRVAGIIGRKTYKGQVRNLRELLTAIVNGKATQNLIMVNQAALNAAARQYGPELARFVPGTVAIEENSISTRRKA